MTTKYTKEILQDAVDNSHSVADVLRFLGLKWAGGTHHYISSKIKSYEIDTSHFGGKGWAKGRTSPDRLDWTAILVYDRLNGRKQHTYMLRRAIVDSGAEEVCSECGKPPVWNNKPLVLEIDHIDGNNVNDVPENLRFLCPDCHSQQATTNRPYKYRG